MGTVVNFHDHTWPRDKVFYLAYGSNINPLQMQRRCPGAKVLGTGYMDDAKLAFRYYADAEFCPGAKLPYVLWEISKVDEFNLDKFEGVAQGNYAKEYVDLESGSVALMYKMLSEGVCPPSRDYFMKIKDGYDHFKLKKKFLEKALDESWEEKRHSNATRRRSWGQRLLRSKRLLEKQAKENKQIEKQTNCKFPAKAVEDVLDAKAKGKLKTAGKRSSAGYKNLNDWLEDQKNGGWRY